MTHGDTLLVGYRTSKALPTLPGRDLVIVDRRDSSILHYYDSDWCIGGKRTYERFCESRSFNKQIKVCDCIWINSLNEFL